MKKIGKIQMGLKLISGLILLIGLSWNAQAQRHFENLNRGLTAVQTSGGVFVSWRLLGTEWENTSYNIYRDGIKVNPEPLLVSNFLDLSGTSTSSYTVTSVKNETESEACPPVFPASKQYHEITLKQRDTQKYEINDGTAADLDGDGEYEIIIKRICKGWNEDNTDYSYFEAYKLDGTFLWEINVGPNILPDVEINIAAFDFDEDGKAEVFLRTSEGTIFGDGTQIGDTDNDGRTNYRYSVGTAANMQYMNAGPEFLSLVDGLTGAELDRVDFIPRGQSIDWGDNYGHRASKYFFGAPYLDGVHPSLFIGRGIYTKTIMRTYDIVNKQLVLRWEFNSGTSGPYFGQGNHNYTIADTDGDGRDEIVWGSMTVDDDGKGLFSTDLGHGDALHVGDLDPYRKGTEVWKCLENSPVYGTVYYDGASGDILIHDILGRDCGRCMAANITDNYNGAEMWGSNNTYSATTLDKINAGGSVNYRIFWDGDLLDELLDHTGFSTTTGYGTGSISKYGQGDILVANGAISCNYTKGTPTLQADLYGDWREEVIWRTTDNTKIRIYTTVFPTEYRIYTLMHDHQYRQAIAWQMCGYNQPPHPSFFLGEAEGKTVPPPPFITNDKLVYNGSGNWTNGASVFTKNGQIETLTSNENILFDVSVGDNVNLTLETTVTPQNVTVNSPGNYTIDASSGKLSGAMSLIKQGPGMFQLNGNHDFTGSTEVWQGKLKFDGELSNSKVLLEFFGEMDASGSLKKGVEQRFGSKLSVASEGQAGKLLITGDLKLAESTTLSLDIAPVTDSRSDTLIVDGNIEVTANAFIQINWNPANPETDVDSGKYTLISFSGNLNGDLANIKIEGLPGRLYELTQQNNSLILEIKNMRQPATIVWNGDAQNTVWDLAKTDNFTIGEGNEIFVTGDNVVFNDNAPNKSVEIVEDVAPASVWIDAESNYSFSGTGKITGEAILKKSGTGTLAITNTNDFTGAVLISKGILSVKSLPDLQNNSSIGTFSTNPANLQIDGGTLKTDFYGTVNRALTVGANQGVLNVTNELNWHEKIIGETLVKEGSGTLLLAGVNTHKKTILKQGTLALFNEETNPGRTVVLEGGILQFFDNSYTYSTIPCNLECAKGYAARLNMDSRAYYTGTLTGEGALYINIPFVRTELKGNWSNFEGVLKFISSNGSAVDVRINNSYGYGKASVDIGANTNAYNLAGSSVAFGELTGNGTLTGTNAWIVGGKNTDSSFDGIIAAGSLQKIGTGTFTLTNSNTYTGGTTVEKGTLMLSNSGGSATGTANVTVKSGGNLAGRGTMQGNLYVLASGAVSPGDAGIGLLRVNGNVNFSDNSYCSIELNPSTGSSDKLLVGGNVTLNGILYLSNAGTSDYEAGNSFQIFRANAVKDSFDLILPTTPGEGLAWDLSEMNTEGIIKVTVATGINDINNSGEITLFPNPVDRYLTIRTTKPLFNSNIQLFDLNGKLLLQKNELNGTEFTLDIQELTPGSYVLQLQSDKNTSTYKFIKSNGNKQR